MKKFILLVLASTLTFASTSAASQRDSLIEKIDQSMASQTYAQQVKTREGIKSKIIAASSKASDTSKFESILDAVNDHVVDLKKNLENNQTSVK
ncbi:hypothetical protein KA037_01800 [Patescibacteria group bacterium]|nr:hypothetical protein [Patescibacteria group bacterium]MBP7841397.1 hypothetical protein [Patescibacteria group bacterium]